MSSAQEQIRAALQNGQFDDAYSLCEKVLAQEAASEEALYLAAVSARYAGKIAAARKHQRALLEQQPEFGRAFQEVGHLERDEGNRQAALTAYRRAVAANPMLEASWRAIASMAEAAEAKAAAARSAHLKTLSPHVLAAGNHLHEGRPLRAESLLRAYLQQHPRDVEAMRLLAQVGMQLGILDDAEFLLESAVAFAPENASLRLDYADVLRRRQKFEAARDQAQWLHDKYPENPAFQSHLAIESLQTGDYERALSLFDQVLEKLPEDAATLTSKGHALKTLGRREEAEASYHAAIAAAPGHGDAFHALANLKTYRFQDSEIDAMEVLLDDEATVYKDRVYMHFAIGKAYEDGGEYERSFAHYERGNRLKQIQSRYDKEQMTAELRRQADFFTPDLFARKGDRGCSAPDPIFVLGLPRAGSTLIEQILASHSMIDGTLELPDIPALAHRLRGRKAGQDQYPDILGEMDGEELRKLGEEYLENTRVHRGDAPFFIDKMPNNFRHIGLIRLILPNAKIIDARRAPLDCCWSNFKQLFAEGQEFTYGLEEIGTYYRDYVDLMEHWDEVQPGAVLRVQHEDVLDDLEGQVRRMLDHLGLPFEQACVDFHRTDRAVRTASSEQVRQPINRAGVGAWRPYDEWLGPLREALGSSLSG
ncbi:tetratricopeptide repeat-containing sulfotransferase family protein [Sphingomicrobium sediminis]|uniref:Sulfotransferase n=1 Tax=Sphingomicrobium sediminis TaxID=2950949 RepID=A0A9X2EER4_9SPHN|nr:tetratricopeptide repeat-containing sulfotransferase family protein [Sphingomicrobium sediminis]MCM8556605.1 sulfotransferase [Sphingomicrobium sediminis]